MASGVAKEKATDAFTTIFVSGGRMGLDIELRPDDLKKLSGASFVPLRRQEGE